MANAYATRGTSGHKLLAGFDVHGGGIQIDKTCIYSALQETVAPPKEWKHLHLINLVNSNNDKLHRLAKHLEYEGYALTEDCYYNQVGLVYFIRINTREFRIKKNHILELT